MISMSVSNSRILFVDDEQDVLDGLSRGLRQKRNVWDMRFECSPEAALQAMRHEPADMVVSDMKMPGMTGLEMVVAMQQFAPRSGYIMLTGSADLETAVDAINKAGIFRFYTKPCPPELLIEGIEAGLGSIAGERADPARDAKLAVNQSQSAPEAVTTLTENIGLAALNRLALSVIVVDADARVLFTNRSGGALLSQRDGLMLSGREVCRAAVKEETQELHELIRQATAGQMDDSFDAGTMALSRSSLKRPLSVLVTPLGSRDLRAGETTLAVLFISDPEGQPLPPPATIAKIFDLTKAEAKIVHALVGGSRLEEAAEVSGVTVSTARTYLKQVFSKTDTSRQSELIKLVLAYPRISASEAISEI